MIIRFIFNSIPWWFYQITSLIHLHHRHHASINILRSLYIMHALFISWMDGQAGSQTNHSFHKLFLLLFVLSVQRRRSIAPRSECHSFRLGVKYEMLSICSIEMEREWHGNGISKVWTLIHGKIIYTAWSITEIDMEWKWLTWLTFAIYDTLYYA